MVHVVLKFEEGSECEPVGVRGDAPSALELARNLAESWVESYQDFHRKGPCPIPEGAVLFEARQLGDTAWGGFYLLPSLAHRPTVRFVAYPVVDHRGVSSEA